MLYKIINNIVLYINALVHKAKLYQIKKKIKYCGSNVKILPEFQIGHPEELIIKDFVSLGCNIFINAQGGVTIESGCVFGPEVIIFSVNHIFEGSATLPFSNESISKPVLIGENCWIGARAFILPGVTIGEGSVIAGGAVVTKSFPPRSVIGGNPAKLLKVIDKNDYDQRKANKKYCDWLIDKK